MDFDNYASSYTVVASSETRSTDYFQSPINWQPASMTCSLEPIQTDTLSWTDLWRVGKPIMALVVGWSLGLATGALGLVWLLR
jgi:hypothetical protein